jgi:hypothetical protein
MCTLIYTLIISIGHNSRRTVKKQKL